MVKSEDCTGKCKFYNSQQYNVVSEFSADAGGDGYVHCVVDIACDTCGWTGSTDYSWDFPLPEPKVWECQADDCYNDIDLDATDEDEPKFCSDECKWYQAGYICEYCEEAYDPIDEETVGDYCSQSCKEYKEEEE